VRPGIGETSPHRVGKRGIRKGLVKVVFDARAQRRDRGRFRPETHHDDDRQPAFEFAQLSQDGHPLVVERVAAHDDERGTQAARDRRRLRERGELGNFAAEAERGGMKPAPPGII
jgi:hypothetical protein